MARIVKEIKVEGKRLKALFDNGSLRSYITAEFRPSVSRKVSPITVGLGGVVRRLDERCDLTATLVLSLRRNRLTGIRHDGLCR